MRCPYLSNATKKVCVKMLEAKISGDLNDFDIKHFCNGDPIYCYYFRLPRLEKANENPVETEPKILLAPTLSNEKKPLLSIKDLLLRPDERP